MNTITPADVNRWQASGWFHPLTCRQCRGRGDCERWDVGVVAGDHHVLLAVEFADGLGLICECCGETQDFPDALVRNVEHYRDSGDPKPAALMGSLHRGLTGR